MNLSAADLASPDVSFTWVDGGDGRDVLLTVDIDGTLFTRTATFNVKRPTATITTEVGPTTIKPQVPGFSHATLMFGDLGTMPATVGVRFTASVTLPPEFTGSPEYQWVQKVGVWRIRKFAAGGWTRWTSVGLDEFYPYNSTGLVLTDSPQTCRRQRGSPGLWRW